VTYEEETWSWNLFEREEPNPFLFPKRREAVSDEKPKRAPMSDEQKKKISEALKAKHALKKAGVTVTPAGGGKKTKAKAKGKVSIAGMPAGPSTGASASMAVDAYIQACNAARETLKTALRALGL
jgi:hypothetical protein